MHRRDYPCAGSGNHVIRLSKATYKTIGRPFGLLDFSQFPNEEGIGLAERGWSSGKVLVGCVLAYRTITHIFLLLL
jgi:hypothetical protein